MWEDPGVGEEERVSPGSTWWGEGKGLCGERRARRLDLD
jgi:hypothetical protein